MCTLPTKYFLGFNQNNSKNPLSKSKKKLFSSFKLLCLFLFVSSLWSSYSYIELNWKLYQNSSISRDFGIFNSFSYVLFFFGFSWFFFLLFRVSITEKIYYWIINSIEGNYIHFIIFSSLSFFLFDFSKQLILFTNRTRWMNQPATKKISKKTTNFIVVIGYRDMNEWMSERMAWSEMNSVTVSYETLRLIIFRVLITNFCFLRWEKQERNGNVIMYTHGSESPSV